MTSDLGACARPRWPAIPTAEPMRAAQPSLLRVELLEGAAVRPAPPEAQARTARDGGDGGDGRAIVRLTSHAGPIALTPDTLSRHLLFIGGTGTGKTNAMMTLVAALRAQAAPEDVFVVFDTKGDYLREFYRDGDRVISNARELGPGGVHWNVFADLLAQTDDLRGDEVLEIASTIFEEQKESAGENLFFSLGARDVFAAVLEAMARDGASHTNQDLRRQLEGTVQELWDLIGRYPDLLGARHYLSGGAANTTTARAVLAFMTQGIKAAFSGAFRLPGDFSVRQFVRAKGSHALFIEYDIAAGALLLPIYRVLLDLALKEALSRSHTAGNVFFIMDEFSLLPQLRHVADGVNFGRGLGLKFVVGAQNVGQVYHAYGPEVGQSILSGFGTVFAFRMTDETSRQFVRERYGANRKMITTEHTGRAVGVERNVVAGNVIEDWDLSALTTGQAIAGLPEGDPFFFPFLPYCGRGH